MSARYRLSRQDFTRLTTTRRAGGAFVTLALCSVHGRTERGFASVVSKKSARRAVDRNKAKRRIRAIVRELLSTLPEGAVLVVYGKNGVVKASMQDLRDEIHTLFQRLLPPSGRT